MSQTYTGDIDNLLRLEYLENPCPAFKHLQMTEAIHWNPRLNGWMVSRYDDVVALLQDPRLSSATPFGYMIKRTLSAEEKNAIEVIRPYVEMSLLNMDPPAQTRQRAILGTAFTPRRLAKMREPIQRFVNDLLDDIESRGRLELLHEFAFPLLFRVIFTLLGLPEEMHLQAGRLFNEGSRLIIQFNSSPNPASEHILQFADNLLTTEEFIRPIVEARREQQREDIISIMVEAEKQGKLSEKEIYVLCSQLVFAAHETTANAICSGMLALLQHSEQLAAIQAHPEQMSLAVEEILRYTAPGQMRPRTAFEDIEIRGIHIEKGQRVFVMLAAANYDDEHFSESETLQLERSKGDQIMTFGHGIHYCLGAALARLELQIIIPSLLNRLPGLRLTSSTVQWRPNFLLRGLVELPLEFDAIGR